jgi:hypothetical protein
MAGLKREARLWQQKREARLWQQKREARLWQNDPAMHAFFTKWYEGRGCPVPALPRLRRASKPGCEARKANPAKVT